MPHRLVLPLNPGALRCASYWGLEPVPVGGSSGSSPEEQPARNELYRNRHEGPPAESCTQSVRNRLNACVPVRTLGPSGPAATSPRIQREKRSVGQRNRTSQGHVSMPPTGFEDRAGHQVRRSYHGRLLPGRVPGVNVALQSNPRCHRSSSSSPIKCPTSCITVMPICSMSSSRVFAKRSRFFWYSTMDAG